MTAEVPAEFSLQPANISLEEYSTVNLSCLANVGSPGGYVTIWKQSDKSNLQIELGRTSSSDKNDGNCSFFANLTIAYNLTRSDNGIIFGCTSKNRHIQDPTLSKDIGPTNILCKYINYICCSISSCKLLKNWR